MNNTENPLKNTQSHDWNKERLDTLKKLYPDLFVNEGKVDIREIAKLMDYTSINEVERYEFRWFGKSNAKREAFTPTDATLVYDKARSVNPTESENLIIEGENLEVLKLLSNSYREQIKCIYKTHRTTQEKTLYILISLTKTEKPIGKIPKPPKTAIK